MEGAAGCHATGKEGGSQEGNAANFVPEYRVVHQVVEYHLSTRMYKSPCRDVTDFKLKLTME